MPRLARRPPTYSHHKPSGQARVRYRGKDYYLGPFGSAASKEAYARLIAQLMSDEPGSPSSPERPADAPPITVSELIARFWAHAQTYYMKDGRPTGEHKVIRCALRPLRKLFGSIPAAEFG